MSRESSLVPTNLLEWPRVRSLLPEQKFIFQSLWSAPFIQSVGVGELTLLGFSAALSISPDAVMTGINNLVSAKLIEYDQETNEIFVVDWFRFHKFKNFGIDIAQREIKKVRSVSLKKTILEKSKGCLPTPSPTSPSPPHGGSNSDGVRKPKLGNPSENGITHTPYLPSGSGNTEASSGVSSGWPEEGETLEWPPAMDELERDQVRAEWKMIEKPRCRLQHALDEVRALLNDNTRKGQIYSPARWVAKIGRNGLTRTPAGRKFEDARDRNKLPQEGVPRVFDKIDLEMRRKKLADLKAVVNIHTA